MAVLGTMTEQQRQQRMDAAARICAAAYLMVCCMNDTADYALEDAADALRHSRYWRHDVKRACNRTLAAYETYTRKLKDTLSGAERWRLWIDYADEYHEAAAPHVLRLRLAFKQALDTHRLTETELCSYVLTADTLLQLSVVNFDRYFDSMQTKHGFDIRRIFRPARLDGVKREWEGVCRVVLNRPGVSIDLNGDPRIALAIKALDTQLMSETFINKAGERALALHDEIKLEE